MPNKYLDSVGLAEYTSLIKGELAPKASPAFTGTPTAPTPTAGDDSTKIATTEFVNDAIDTEITSEIAAEVTRADGKYLPFAGGTLTGVVNGVTPTAGDDSTKLATTEYVQEEIRTHANMPIGHEYFTMNPNIPQGSLPLFGGEYSRETYADLWAWVQQQTGYFITDSAWQAMANSQSGNVPFYSDGDGSTTFRVPSLKCWIKAANGTVTEVGSYKAAGLPNITGVYENTTWNYNGSQDRGGALNRTTGAYSYGSASGSNPSVRLLFDASASNSIYGNSTTVQPESIVGMWLVRAYGVVVDTGTINEQQYIDDRIAALPTSLATTFLPLAGGTMSGEIVWSGSNLNAIKRDSGNDGVCIIGGDADNFSGATLQLFGQTQPTYAGQFYLRASTRRSISDTSHPAVDLHGQSNGSLTWNGKEVERVNSSGTNYIRYESGLQICWGAYVTTQSGGTWTTITFPVAFKSGTIPATNINSSSGASHYYAVNSLNNTSFKTEGAGNSVHYIAVGLWK